MLHFHIKKQLQMSINNYGLIGHITTHVASQSSPMFLGEKATCQSTIL